MTHTGATEAMLFAATTAVFTDVCRAYGLCALITEADRHGSMVWEAAEDSGGLCRSVSVALTTRSLATAARPAIYLVETWAAADGASYHRRLITAVGYHYSLPAMQGYRDQLRLDLERAIECARDIRPEDVTEPDVLALAAMQERRP